MHDNNYRYLPDSGPDSTVADFIEARLRISSRISLAQSSKAFCSNSRWDVALFTLGDVAVEKFQLLRT